jgi:isopenicillin-N epimerase
MRRRDFLLASAALASWPSAASARPAPGGALADPGEVALHPGRVHLAGFLLASHPRAVRDAIERHRRGLDEDPAAYWALNNRKLEEDARSALAAYIGAEPREVALTDSTTMGLGLVYGAIRMLPGAEILHTDHDHYATRAAIAHRAACTGATVRSAALYDDPATVTADALVRAVAREIRPETRILALTWVHSSTGVKLPIGRIAEEVARRNADRADEERLLLVVDGVHGFGLEPDLPAKLGADVFVAGTHKWMCGPRGTGFVWAGERGRAALMPIIASFSLWGEWGGLLTPGGFHSFEHRWALADACRWHASLGRDAVAAHVHGLAKRLKDGLWAMPHVRVATPLDPEVSAGIVSFDVEGLTPYEVVDRLQEAGIVGSVAPYERTYARLAPSIFTSADDVDRALQAVAALQ